MEELRYKPCVGINTGEVWALVQITFRTGKREVVGAVHTTMLAGDDVLNVKTQV
jgi:hypothetical protein